MDILKITANSGMIVILNDRIGSEEYRSVYGSIQALQRFADALLVSAENETRDKRPGVRASLPSSE
ncbi:hypothetical protein [Paraburkholderia elongata]|uniref:Uncharacterized protein n=1 Tax=Paraburkholderia elongata TaxID=2675747 RepID=A0A972SMM3_9BURK|nr:hypothetical protein [Paraburkholderia elongata]NPT60327.1 hypothetical protein [Paraburkholderia elongata]